MIDRFLRRLTVRSRIVGGFALLLVMMALFAPLLITAQSFIVDRLRQITEVEARADRFLLLAAARIESSRVNTMRYIQDYAPSTYEALDDVDQASDLLTEARGLISSPEQQAALDTILVALTDYRTLVQQVETARSGVGGEDVSRLLFQAYRLGNDIGQRIEQVVSDSEARIAAGNEAILAQIQDRLILVGAGYAVAVILALILSSVIQRSITWPVAELRRGADAFRQGQMDVAVPVAGNDELSLLGQTFNELTAQLRGSIASLEQRVADRTRDLEQRAVELATAADVGRAAASILDLETLTRQVVNLVRERFDLYYAGLFLLDSEGRYAVLAAGTGEAGQIMLDRGHKLEVGGISMVGTACAQRQARIALDVAAGEEARGTRPEYPSGWVPAGASLARFDNPLLPQTRSEMALPLIIGGPMGTVLGALDVQSTLPAAFSEEDVAVLQLVADQVAVAVQNARFFAESQVSLEAARRAYGEISREAWRRLLESRGGARGYISDEQGLVPLSQATEPHPQGERMAGSDEAIPSGPRVQGAAQAGGLDEDVRGYSDGDGGPDQAWALPIQVRDQVIGVIDAQKPEGAGAWTAEEKQVLAALVEQLGVALESARLYQDTQQRAAQERLVGEVTARMRETLDMDAVLQTAAREMRAALDLVEVEVRLDTAATVAGQPEGIESV
ncbi:MAG: GAF domain-containing protein [Anaerolineae bacterium]|nr:GAF domain-containing protein [Anaerolineae bacterium]